MKYIFYLILTSFLAIPSNAIAMVIPTVAIKDSLLHIADTSADMHAKFMAFRNLADIYFEKPEEIDYLKKMYQTAKTANDKENTLETLKNIVFAYIKIAEGDSISYYMNLLQKEGDYKETVPYLSYLRMRLFDYRVRNNDGAKATQEELNFLNNPDTDKNDIHIQIEQAYTIGCGLYHQDKYPEANSYLETAYKLSSQLSPKEQYEIGAFVTWSYASTFNYLNNGERFIELIEEIYQKYKTYYEQAYAANRPFYHINLKYLQCYTNLFMRCDILPKDKVGYYLQLIKKISNTITEPLDKYNYYLAMNNYYLQNQDYPRALSTNDSLIKYARIAGPNNIPGLLDISSQIYEAMQDYEGAFKYHKLYTHLKDSISSSEFQAQLNELQVKYDVDQLNYKNSELENKNKQTQLVALSIILLLAIGACTYLYFDLKRERQIKKKLSILNKKAEESEKMKTAFINSMCHEIRTPLNAIVGFSGLVTDKSIDEVSKGEFYNLIETNANMLTSLIDHLLVVANLDSSEELLPCESINIKQVCIHEMAKIERQAKPDISYQLELPNEEIFISTNEQYLSLVIENLLNNANKFTEKGSITLKMWIDKAQRRLRIDVIDSGCGIPKEKAEIVFERFSKLNDFTQGNGLGLYLSRLIIKRLSGEIFVNADYTGGTNMIIYLPL